MILFKEINIGLLFLLIIFIGLMTSFSFYAAYGMDEGTLPDNVFLELAAHSFYLFRNPTHTLFAAYFRPEHFMLGLLINSLLFSFLIERLVFFLRRNR